MSTLTQYLKVHSRFLTENNPESSPFMQEFRLCLVYFHLAKEVLSWVWPTKVRAERWGCSSDLETGLDFLLILGWYHGTALRSAVCCCRSQTRTYSSRVRPKRQKPFPIAQGNTHRERSWCCGPGINHFWELEIKALLWWWVISLHNSPLDVLDTATCCFSCSSRFWRVFHTNSCQV